jgi:hypothetical protein
VAGGLLLRVLLKMKMKAWSIGGTVQKGDDRRKTCCSAAVCITHPPGNGSSFNPDRLRHGTSVTAKNHISCISKIRFPPHRKHSPLYKEQPGKDYMVIQLLLIMRTRRNRNTSCSVWPNSEILHVPAVGMPTVTTV